ncbi:hypothetical protein M670_00416 [Schinkia azotoformans MEV2011]|uniref:Uncharacterized protein n=1 Tax=Schinkia azotoformans MEV2011 TaxID=1348973 RepID=A0A072P4I2_SCHAZ|nr:hypothetical protein [Schinkia azotoformans]KEF40390.1 hypothetical protein M670_00416 [Schinkia azotoformans MEV2011]MEC1696198.1 hypothetical protein [Schinkia azotoformans]MEC1725299.1 hypothetical protein [Schinkia azotoformans]
MITNTTKIEPIDYSKDIDFLRGLIETIQSDVQFTVNVSIAVLAVAITIAGWALSVLVRKWVNEKVDQELNKRLINLLKNNPPVFSASGSSNPDVNKKIYLSEAIQGIDQLESENVIMLNVNPEHLTWNDIERKFSPKILRNRDGVVEIEIPEYHENNGLIHWKIVWLRKHYDFK